MAIKALRKYDEGTDIAYVVRALPSGVTYLERGIVMIVDTDYSGTGKVGDGNNVVKVPTGTSGAPRGLLLTDVEDIDLSQHPHLARNYRDVVPLCSPVTLLTHGYVFTNKLVTGNTPTAGTAAHFNTDGKLTTTTTSTRVGTFRGVKDADGYVGVDINIGV